MTVFDVSVKRIVSVRAATAEANDTSATTGRVGADVSPGVISPRRDAPQLCPWWSTKNTAAPATAGVL